MPKEESKKRAIPDVFLADDDLRLFPAFPTAFPDSASHPRFYPGIYARPVRPSGSPAGHRGRREGRGVEFSTYKFSTRASQGLGRGNGPAGNFFAFILPGVTC